MEPKQSPTLQDCTMSKLLKGKIACCEKHLLTNADFNVQFHIILDIKMFFY